MPSIADQAVRRAARRVATAMRQAGVQAVEQHARRAVRAVVLNVSPLALDVHGEDLTLYDDDVDFSQDVERYAATEGLAVGDELALLEATEGQWVAVTVISDTAVTPVGAGGGGGTTSPATTSALGLVELSNAPAVPAHPVVVEDADPRNSNARAPTAHTHPQTDVTGLATALAAKIDTSDLRLSDTRTPTDGTVTDAKIAAGGLSPAKIAGTAVVTADSRLSDARAPAGSAGGDLGGTYPNPTVVQINGRAVSAVVFTDDGRLSRTRWAALVEAGASVSGGTTANTFPLLRGAGTPTGILSAQPVSVYAFALDSANYDANAKNRIVAWVLTLNGTAPAASFVFHLYSFTIAAGVMTLTAATGEQPVTITTPGGNAMTKAYGAEFAMPAAAGQGFVLACVTSATIAAGASAVMGARLETRVA